MKARDVTPADYFEARRRFVEAAHVLNAWTQAYPITAVGPRGEPLTLDIAYLGPGQPRRLLIVSSGTHGVEGYAGSAIQLAFLRRYGGAARTDTTGLLMVHAVNPYGYAYSRRTNEHNVDLNRNALERFPGPANPAYARLDAWLNPRSPPRRPDLFLARGMWHLLRTGPAAVKQAVAGGQYEYPKGLFYGGGALADSTKRFIEIVGDSTFSGVEQVIHLDLHTGLGRRGACKVLVDFDQGSSAFRQIGKWFGRGAVQGDDPRRSVGYKITGSLGDVVLRAFPKAQVYPAVLEFGTYPLIRMIRALHTENRAHFYTPADSAANQRAKAQLREIFFPRAGSWRTNVLSHGLRTIRQALAALRG
ncbi:MAG: DUF2817 domain-containing protein [Gammaproteobacteria bacterium]